MKRSPVTPSLYAPDIAKTIEFYVNNLGFEPAYLQVGGRLS